MEIRLRSAIATICLTGTMLGGVGAAPASAGLVNPHFDTGVEGWSTPDGDLSWDSAVDADGCAGSGSASLSTPDFITGNWTVTLVSTGSCVPVTPGEQVAIRVRMKPGAAIAHTDFSFLEYTDDQCTSGESERLLVGYSTLPQSWLDLLMGALIFEGTGSVRFLMRLTDASVSTYQLTLDSVYVGVGQPVLLDDFEAGSPCRWSEVAP